MIFDFVFEKPLEIIEGKIGTTPYALPYGLLARKEIQKEGMVELLVKNWNRLYPKFLYLHNYLENSS